VVSAFISYAHGDAGHERDVLRLYKLLVAAGIDAILDTFHSEAGRDWKSWCRAKIDEADFTLVIASRSYRLRADHPEQHPADGRGVWWEADYLAGLMYDERHAAYSRILPVLLPGAVAQDLPRSFAKGRHVYTVERLTPAGVSRSTV